MAATVSPWAKPGAWALEAEENENELLQQRKLDDKNSSNRFNGVETADFPSLSDAASTKTKKKKPQKLSLQEFSTYGSAKPTEPAGLTPEELLMLPTGPRQRTAEELDRNKLGGGFRSYGGGARDEQQLRRLNRESSNNREFTPSRADETDNWAAAKKAPSSFGGSDRRERGGFFSDSASRADDVDNWASKKSFVPSEPRRYEKRGGFGMDSGNGGGADSNNWLKRKEEEGRKTRGGSGGAFDSLRERRGGLESSGGGVDGETWGRKREDVVSSDGSRPRLNLQPRTLPVGEGENKSEVKSGNKGLNPFGKARPREEVLKGKGQDWKEMEQKLESLKVKEIGAADVGKKESSFWSGIDRGHVEAKAERAWTKPVAASDNSRPQSVGESENGQADDTGNEHAAEVEEKDSDAQI